MARNRGQKKKKQYEDKQKDNFKFNNKAFQRQLKAEDVEYIMQQKEEKALIQKITDKFVKEHFVLYHELFTAARSIKRKVKFFVGPTNSGKTYNAINELVSHETGVYLAPLRLLALEGQEEITSRGFDCSFITGEERDIFEGAKFIAQTIETMNMNEKIDAMLIDEIQMISDANRGWAWTKAFVGAPAKHLILTGSYDCLPLIKNLCSMLGDELEIVELKRFTTLTIEEESTPLTKDNIANIKDHTAIIVFSRKNVLRLKDLFEEAHVPVSIIYGNLSPEVRREEARKFREGETKILISTDAIAMGLNLPIERLIIGETKKFNGTEVVNISSNEVRQICGRAGRYGKFAEGFVGATSDEDLRFIRRTIQEEFIPKNILYVKPSLEQVMLLSELLKTKSISIIHDKFKEIILKQNDIYRCADMDQMEDLFKILDTNPLTVEEKFNFSILPVDSKTPECLSTFNKWVESYVSGNEIEAKQIMFVPSSPTKSFLLNAEINLKILSAYSWLALRQPEFAPEYDKCAKEKQAMNDFICETLKSKNKNKPKVNNTKVENSKIKDVAKYNYDTDMYPITDDVK